jgi:hypothetical protein
MYKYLIEAYQQINENYIMYKDGEYSDKMNIDEIKNLKEGQKVMTEMLREFDRICRKYNIKYWCEGGTLLGVIRNEGWIPYDADIDVGMSQIEYNKFKEIIDNNPGELSDDIFISEGKIGVDIVKLQHRKWKYIYTEWLPRPSADVDKGIQIDIFIRGWESESNSLKWKDEDLFPLKERYFEGIKVYVPNNYEKYFETWYGKNWKEEFPVDKRFPHEGMIKKV